MNIKVIGLSGIAGSGKDLFFQLLTENSSRKIQRFALADDLKVELRAIIKDLYGIDILTCSREDKDKIRPMLVAHGKIRRNISDGRHWIDITKKKIETFLLNNPEGIACVTDVRYDVFEKDEAFFLKEEMGGILVHISKYTMSEGLEFPYVKEKIFGLPPNQDETDNDPKIKAKSDYQIEWPQMLNEKNKTDISGLTHYAKNFLSFAEEFSRD